MIKFFIVLLIVFILAFPVFVGLAVGALAVFGGITLYACAPLLLDYDQMTRLRAAVGCFLAIGMLVGAYWQYQTTGYSP